VEGERATWHQVQLTGRREQATADKKRRRKEKGDAEEEAVSPTNEAKREGRICGSDKGKLDEKRRKKGYDKRIYSGQCCGSRSDFLLILDPDPT
jgi:hypothetical protein